MRMEQIVAKALDRLNNDRYSLSNPIFARVKELSLGAPVLVENMNTKTHKLTDIAIFEIAEGKVTLEKIQDENADFF